MSLRYNTGLHYNSHLRYPGGAASHQPRKAMNKIKLELNLKTDAMLLIYAKNHKTKITGNADFVSPVPDATDYNGKLTAYENSLTGITGAENDLTAALATRDATRLALENALRDRAGYVETTSVGDAVKIAGAGFQLVSAAAPLGALPAPQNVRVTPGDNQGDLLVRWARVKGAGGYILECREHGPTLGPWQQVKILTQAKYLNTGLVTGKEYSFRVRAVGTAGEGPWSDEAVKHAP
jgi:hypothetical protein